MQKRAEWLQQTISRNFKKDDAVFLVTPGTLQRWSWLDIDAKKVPDVSAHDKGTLDAFRFAFATLSGDNRPVDPAKFIFITLFPNLTSPDRPAGPGTDPVLPTAQNSGFPVDILQASSVPFAPLVALVGTRSVNRFEYSNGLDSSKLEVD